MSDKQAKDRILDELRSSREPVPGQDLFCRIRKYNIDDLQGRRILLDLVDKHAVEITSDRRFEVTDKGELACMS